LKSSSHCRAVEANDPFAIGFPRQAQAIVYPSGGKGLVSAPLCFKVSGHKQAQCRQSSFLTTEHLLQVNGNWLASGFACPDKFAKSTMAGECIFPLSACAVRRLAFGLDGCAARPLHIFTEPIQVFSAHSGAQANAFTGGQLLIPRRTHVAWLKLEGSRRQTF